MTGTADTRTRTWTSSATAIPQLHNVKYLMTDHPLPEEEYHALKESYKLLCDLIDPKKYPKIPKQIRINASKCLKHYPASRYWDQVYTTVGFFNPRPKE